MIYLLSLYLALIAADYLLSRHLLRAIPCVRERRWVYRQSPLIAWAWRIFMALLGVGSYLLGYWLDDPWAGAGLLLIGIAWRGYEVGDNVRMWKRAG